MTTKHTPTPWSVSHKENKSLIRSGTVLTASCDCGSHSELWPSNAEMQANAAFIVKAVNCHDELVEALDEAELLFTGNMTCDNRRYIYVDGKRQDNPNFNLKRYTDCIAAMRSILAKAKEQ